MAAYRITIKASAAKELDAISRKGDRRRLVARIRSLAREPRPPGCEKLVGEASRFRVRQGPYRVVYAIDDAQGIVSIVKIGHRREVYR